MTVQTRQIDLEKMNRILQSTSVAELWGHFLNIQAGFGFDRLFFVSTFFGTISHWGDKSDWLLLTNHHQEIVDRFVGEDLYRHTAKVHLPPGGAPGAYSWRQTRQRKHDRPLSEQERKHQALTEKHGVSSGYTIWFPQANQRSKTVLGLCACCGLSQDDVDAQWKDCGDEVMAYATIAQLKLASLPHPNVEKRLTARQIEVLEWVADGKTGRDIAQIMSLSPVTVEKHLRQIRSALNVETTAQAVKKMATLNQLFLVKENARKKGPTFVPLVSSG